MKDVTQRAAAEVIRAISPGLQQMFDVEPFDDPSLRSFMETREEARRAHESARPRQPGSLRVAGPPKDE